MERSDLTDGQYNKLLDAIFPIILEKGPSHTTMDHVANRLSMSKRTLYEIFGSKDDMMLAVFEHSHQRHANRTNKIYLSADNAMEGLVKVIAYHQYLLDATTPEFFRDMDTRCKHLRPDYDKKSKKLNEELEKVILIGIRQGVFRKASDYELQLSLLRVQMESLKRMEEFFPANITFGQAYRAMSQNFLRSIATQKGLEILENINEEKLLEDIASTD